MMISCIAAMDEKQGIGKNGVLPWRLPKELAYFHSVTLGNHTQPLPSTSSGQALEKEGRALKLPSGKRNAVLMGRTTWESIPEDHKPLKGRLNIVLTTNKDYPLPEGVMRAGSFDEAMTIAEEAGDIHDVMAIGGRSVFEEAMQRPECRKLYLTNVDGDFACDTFYPEIPDGFVRTWSSDPQEEKSIRYTFTLRERK